jgi:hypothetical protein
VNSTSDGVMLVVNKNAVPNFGLNAICHYQVQYPSNAVKGDMVYLRIIIMRNVIPYIFIGTSMNSTTLTQCNPIEGDYLVAYYPNKFFVSLVATAKDSSSYYQIIAQYAKYSIWEF